MAGTDRTGRLSREEARIAALGRLRAACERLLASGVPYAELTVERIARESGLAKSTFYFHFEDMGALLVAALEHVQGDCLQAADRWFGAPFPIPYDELVTRLDDVFSAYRRHELLLAAVVDASAREAAVGEVYLGAIRHFEHAAAAHMERGRADGLLSDAVDPRRTAAWLVWMFERGLYQMVRGAEAAERRRCAETLACMVWRAIYAPDTY